MLKLNHLQVYLILYLLQIGVFQATAQTAPRTLLRTGHLLDVKTGAEPSDQTVIVIGDRISGVAPTASTPKQMGDTEIDLTRYTVMPGLIDVIAVEGDPLKDVKILQHVSFVMKSGVVYKDEAHKQ